MLRLPGCALQVNASFSSAVNMAQPQSPPPAAHHGPAPSLGQQFFTHIEVCMHCIALHAALRDALHAGLLAYQNTCMMKGDYAT